MVSFERECGYPGNSHEWAEASKEENKKKWAVNKTETAQRHPLQTEISQQTIWVIKNENQVLNMIQNNSKSEVDPKEKTALKHTSQDNRKSWLLVWRGHDDQIGVVSPDPCLIFAIKKQHHWKIHKRFNKNSKI